MKILICGDRNWTDEDLIQDAMEDLHYDTVVIVGGARGADSIAEEIAIDLKLPRAVFPARWDLFGPAAGPKRNQQMLDQEPDVVWAFHDNLKKSKGTKDTVTEAKRRGIKVRKFHH